MASPPKPTPPPPDVTFPITLPYPPSQLFGIAPEKMLNPFCMVEVSSMLGFLVILRQVMGHQPRPIAIDCHKLRLIANDLHRPTSIAIDRH